jgi:aryl sulfotransferase
MAEGSGDGRALVAPGGMPLRRYAGYISDSDRWTRFRFRSDDIVISTPSKCGTTWMQTIVGMLVLDRLDLGVPLSSISPWLDMLLHTEEDTFSILENQSHRRFIKTHAPLDAVPDVESVTYITVTRHPLDAALSLRDHHDNLDMERLEKLRIEASGEPPDEESDRAPEEDPVEYLRWFIDHEQEPDGAGPDDLKDYCHQIRTYWDARDAPNVHLFHYADMWNDLEREMRRVAEVLGVSIDERRWPQFVDAATLKSMRQKAAVASPEAEYDLWKSPDRFFRAGGTRNWASLLTPAEIELFDGRLRLLAGDMADWCVGGWDAVATNARL